MKTVSANGLEVYGGLVQERISHGEQEPHVFCVWNPYVVRDVRSVMREHHLPRNVVAFGGAGTLQLSWIFKRLCEKATLE